MTNPSLVSLSGPQTMTAGGTGGDPSSYSNIISGLGSLANLGGSIYGLVNSASMIGNANTAFVQSNPFGQYRPLYGAQLLNLMQNPSSIANDPGYKFLMDQGTQAIERAAAGPGGTGFGSGAMGTALEQYGQGLASQFYQQDISNLARFAGVDINPANPASALQAKGGAASSLGSSITGLTSSASNVAQLLSKAFGSGGNTSSLTPQEQQQLSSLFSGSYGNPYTPYDTGFSNGQSNLGYDPTTGSFSGGSTPSFSQYSLGSGYDPTTGSYDGGPDVANMSLDDSGGGGGMDLSGMFSNPNSAGGEAATNAGSGVSALGAAGAGIGIVRGLASGTPTGYAGAAIGAAQLGAKAGAFGSYSAGVGAGASVAGGALGIYSGLQQGGVAGDTQVALGSATAAAPIATAAGASTLGASLAAAGPISLAIAPALIGMSTPAYTMPASFYQNMRDILAKGPGQTSKYMEGNSPEAIQQGIYLATILGAQENGDAEQKFILQQFGIDPNAPMITQAQYSALQNQGAIYSRPTTHQTGKL